LLFEKRFGLDKYLGNWNGTFKVIAVIYFPFQAINSLRTMTLFQPKSAKGRKLRMNWHYDSKTTIGYQIDQTSICAIYFFVTAGNAVD
jgi:hypothetical protein